MLLSEKRQAIIRNELIPMMVKDVSPLLEKVLEKRLKLFAEEIMQNWPEEQAKADNLALAAKVEQLRAGLNQAIELLVTGLNEPEQIKPAEIWDLRHLEKTTPKECLAQYSKKIAVEFYYWWHNQPGTNTKEGFDDWWKLKEGELW